MKFAMQDGRSQGDIVYMPDCSFNQLLQQKYNVSNSHDYRYFLQKNAEKLMNEFKSNAQCKFCPVCQAALNYLPTGDTQFQITPAPQ
jgi:hypothetical protein